MPDTVDRLRADAQDEAGHYRQGEPRPLGGYVAVMAVFSAIVAGAAGIAAATRDRGRDAAPSRATRWSRPCAVPRRA